MDHRSLRAQAEASHAARVRERRGESPSDAAADKARVGLAIQQHNNQLHGGVKAKLHLKDGGRAEGGAAPRRLDRPGRKRDDGGSANAMDRAVTAGLAKALAEKNENAAASVARARGGRSGKKGGKGPGHVNVIVATGSPQGQDRPVPVPVPVPGAGGPPRPPMPPPGAAGPMGPGGPPMPPPGAGMPPPGLAARPPMMGPGMPPPGMRADGGKTLAVKMTAGADSGQGRLEKMKLKTVDANAAAE